MVLDSFQNIRVGTCGWSYKEDWKDVFYPSNLPENKFLEYYSQFFCTNEIDSSFYHTPKLDYVQSWINNTPDNFTFSAKFPQDFTHKCYLDMKKGKTYLDTHIQAFTPMELANRMNTHLLQLPPKFTKDEHQINLENFLNYWAEWRSTEGQLLLKGKLNPFAWRLCVEFRHISWITPNTFELLNRYGATYCAVIEPTLPPRMDITTPDLFYLRFHGYGKKIWFDYLFSDSELSHWAKELSKLIEENPKIITLAYFNNHFSGNAVKNALDFIPKMGLPKPPDIKTISLKYQGKIKKDVKNLTPLDKWIKNK
jgi:uncharacterized protein YecE (DUF72 family)